MKDSTFLTGGSGRVGRVLAGRLGITPVKVDLTRDDGWMEQFRGKHRVIHCAGLASSRGTSPERVKEVNLEGTCRIARLARDCGVRRFLFLSSVKVFGENTADGECFSDDSPRNPSSVYAESKARAEDALMELHQSGTFEVVILRPTVVLSPGAGGAVGLMETLARRGLPFPVPSGGNQRDFVSVENLVDAILHSVDHPASAGGSFCVRDGAPISTGDLFEAMAGISGRRGHKLIVPRQPSLLISRSLGLEATWNRLLGNLRVDDSGIRQSLGWQPLHSTIEFVENGFTI